MKTTVARYLVSRFNQVQVDSVFSATGANTQPILREIVANKTIQLISGNTDIESAHASIGYSKTKGFTQQGSQQVAVFVGSSQTISNAISAIQVAYQENVPVIVINCAPSAFENIKTTQQVSQGVQDMQDQFQIHNQQHFGKMCVHSEFVTSAQLASVQIDTAIQAAMTLSAPVYIEVQENVWNQETSEPSGRIAPRSLTSAPQEFDRAIKYIAQAIKDCKNPLVWFGADVARFGARSDAMKWISKIGVNFITSIGSKSVIDEKNERFVGVYAGKSSSKYVQEALRGADAIFVVGETVTENETIGQSLQDIVGMQGRRFIFVNADSVVEPSKFVAAPVYIREMMTACANSTEMNKFGQKIASGNQEKDSVNLNQQGQLTYDSIVAQFNQAPFIGNSSIVVDGTLGVVSCATMSCKQDSFIASNGNGHHYGSSIATCVGVAAGNSNKRPVVFIGDGALISSGQAIATLSKMRSNAIIVVFNNGMYGINQWSSNPRVYSNPRDPVDSYNMVQKWNPVKFAEAFDAVGFSVDSATSLAEVIKRIEGADKVTIVDCKIPQKNIPSNCQWRVPNQ